ncbi:hypothetical protein WH52_12635 [Tenacibaculum holothuriorum]|uniref:Uncharacterized protein n=1 Tax=Tenacibaculum holothuriorum TaxID=1635173 RepID=A0A1Y2PAB9_9FLAO|nr:hypothetical protein WH52_12635 [Tenacibaculum holothuriorum]
MITSILFLLLTGSIFLYSTSSKTMLNNLTSSIKLSNFIGVSLLIIALYIATIYLGTFSGFLFWLISFIVFLSLVIIIYPLKIINYKYLIVLVLFSLSFEIISSF